MQINAEFAKMETFRESELIDEMENVYNSPCII